MDAPHTKDIKFNVVSTQTQRFALSALGGPVLVLQRGTGLACQKDSKSSEQPLLEIYATNPYAFATPTQERSIAHHFRAASSKSRTVETSQGVLS